MSRNVMTRTPRITHVRRTTSTAKDRGRQPRPTDIIPAYRRHILEAPCELCDQILWIWYADGLCTLCRGHRPPCRACAHAGATRPHRDCTDCARIPL
jgi:hypothetical protein